jgi:hypothetical protein
MTDIKPTSDKLSSLHVEEAEPAIGAGFEVVQVHTMGTVKLTEGEIVYIPTPTADPQGKYISNI